jgi:quinol monooxygenase YgiN
MLEKVVRLTVELTVNDGQLEEFKNVAKAMNAGSESEPGTLGYEWFFSADGKTVRLLETYVDAAAIEAHFTGPVVGELVPKLVPLCKVERMEIYGDPGPKVTAMAAGFGGRVFAYWAGLSR